MLRRNPCRAEEMAASRRSKAQKIQTWIDRENTRLLERKKAKPELALAKARAKIAALDSDAWLDVHIRDRSLVLDVNAEALAERERLDGCYVIVTDLAKDQAPAAEVHSRYKDLSLVEQAFRISKTAFLELRPVFVRKADRTRGHVFVAMLAYKIVRRLREAWREVNATPEECLESLRGHVITEVSINHGPWVLKAAKPSPLNAKLLQLIGVTLPKAIPTSKAIVCMRTDLAKHRLLSKK